MVKKLKRPSSGKITALYIAPTCQFSAEPCVSLSDRVRIHCRFVRWRVPRWPVRVARVVRALRRVTIVIIEETTQSLATLDLSGSSADFIARFNDFVTESLMVAFDVIMFEMICDSTTQ